jgi:hypothetical protein
MADLNKFEQMLEKLVNEDKAGAEELFHEIVVEKSRDIYESLLEADLEVDEADEDEADDEEVDETTDEEVDESDEELDEDFNLDEFEVEADPMDAMMGDMEVDGGDEAPAMDMDMGDEEGEGDVEDRVEDLEDALDELKAEFEKMMSGDDEDEGGEEADDMDMDLGGDDEEEEAEEESMAFETTDDEVDEASDEEVEETAKSETETMREYVEKVNATMGDNGANTKSATATPNHMGDGTAANLAQGADEKGGKADAAKDMSTGNINVPGGKAAKASKPNAKGHGAEKKGAGETADNKKSTIGK